MNLVRSTMLALPAAALLVAGCGADGEVEDRPHASAVTEPDAHALAFDEPRELVTRDGAFIITWMPTGGAVPVNDHFEVDVTLARNDAARTPVTGADVSMTCYMPDHGHGMLREPRAEELGDGRYRVRGFLLHMGGYWTVSVSAVVDGVAATADDELNL